MNNLVKVLLCYSFCKVINQPGTQVKVDAIVNVHGPLLPYMVPKNWQKSSQKALTINRKEGKNCDKQQFISYAFWLFRQQKISLPLFPQFLLLSLECFLVVV